MARRNRDLAGLAALGALGYAMFGGDRNRVRPDGGAPVEDRGTAAQFAAAQAAAAAEPIDRGEDYAREIGRMGYSGVQGISAPERAPIRGGVVSPRMETVEDVAPRVGAAAMSRGRRGEFYKNPQRGPSYEEIAAYNRQPAPAPRTAAPRTSPRALTREELISQIPTSTGSRYSSVASDIDPSLREDGTELGRNVKNTLAALTPLGGGFGKVGAEMATAKGAAERAARSRELAEEAIRAQKPTKFTSTKSTAPARANAAAKSRSKKFNEEEAGVEFKRGGKIKKMASGGSTSSASKRADGIAMKGKTKCKMY